MTVPPFSITARGPGTPGPRIVLFVEDGGGDWHARRLREALQARGAQVVTTCLKFCAFDTRLPSGIAIPGFDGDLPDGAFVRSVSTGSLEQITLRLGILHALRESGVRVWNDARVIERCVDKSTATFLFQKAGLPVPITRAAEGLDAARTFAAAQSGRPIVVKPLFGSQGNGVRRVLTADELPAPPRSATSTTPSNISAATPTPASKTGGSSCRAAACSPPWPASAAPGSPTSTRAPSRRPSTTIPR